MNIHLYKLVAVLSCMLLPSLSAQSSHDLIADDALIVLKAKNYAAVKNLLPIQFQGQFTNSEMMLQSYDFNKEIVLVVSSIMPPIIYFAAPLKEDVTPEAATATLPPPMQAKAQHKGSYQLLPLQGALPKAFGNSKLNPEQDVDLQLIADIKTLNAKQGPLLSMMLKQGINQLSSSIAGDESTQSLTVIFSLYNDLINAFLVNTEQLDVTVNKKNLLTINNKITFKPGNKFAQTCKNLEASTLPKVPAFEGNFLYSSHLDYSKIAFKDDILQAVLKTCQALKLPNADKLMRELFTAFIDMGNMSMVGSISMKMTAAGLPQDIQQEAIVFSPNAGKIIPLYEKTSTMMKDLSFAGSKITSDFKKADFKVASKDVYTYNTTTTNEVLDIVQKSNVYLSADTKALYMSSKSKEGLLDLMKKQNSPNSKVGIFWMKADYGSMFQNMPLPISIPPIEIILKTKANTAIFEITF